MSKTTRVKPAPEEDQAIVREASPDKLVPVDKRQEARDLVARAKALRITDAKSAEEVTESLVLATRLAKHLDEKRRTLTAPLDTRKKEIMAAFDLVIEPLLMVKKTCDDLLIEWRQKLEAQRKAEEEARERARLDAIALQEKAAAELKRRQQEEWERECAEAKAKGEEAPPVPLNVPTSVVMAEEAPEVQTAVPSKLASVSGSVSMTKRWKAECVDIRVLMQAVLDGKVPQEAVMANDSFLGAQVRAFRRDLGWPGVRCFEVDSSTVR